MDLFCPVPCDQKAMILNLASALQLFCGFKPANKPVSCLACKRVIMTPSLGAGGMVNAEKINWMVVNGFELSR